MALALLAVPTFVWLPREFDIIGDNLETVEKSQIQSEGHINELLLGNERISQELLGLVKAIAQADAEPVGPTGKNELVSDQYMAVMYPKKQDFLELLPVDIGEVLIEGGSLGRFLMSDFQGKKWIFILAEDFNALTSTVQEEIINSFDRQDVNFEVLQ